MKKEIKFTLLKIEENKQIGGLRLVYQVKTRLTNEIKIPLLVNNISLSLYIPKTLMFKKENITFWRPLKSAWDTKRNRLPKNFWGKEKDEYTNLWTIVDFKNIYFNDESKKIVLIKDELRNSKDHILIKFLNRKKSKFTIFTNY